MQGLAALALLLLPVINALPQGVGVVICDNTPVTPIQYDTASTEDVTEQTGDQGWVNYDSEVCSSNTQTCARQEGTEVSTEVSVSFGGGAEFDLAQAVTAGLNFGVSVAYGTAKSQATNEQCPVSSNNADLCVCGLQFKAFKQRATGTSHSSNACGKSLTNNFDVTAPLKIGDSAKVQWRACRSVESTCAEAGDLAPCADGL